MSNPAISVVIPAHNEALVIRRCLEGMLRGAEPGELDVVVACNGCTDGTEVAAAAVDPGVRVVSTAIASKIAALNLGDGLVSGFPRFYVDADVQIGIQDLREVAAPLVNGELLAAAPALELDDSASSLAVRAYLRIWSRLPSVQHGLVGRGVYALSEAGRRRFADFPEVMADDHFVRSLFTGPESASVATARSVVLAPRSVPDVVRRKSRVYAANQQLQRRDAGARQPRTGALSVVRDDPARLPDLAVYVGVTLAALLATRWRRLRGTATAWTRDESSRGI